MLFEGKIEGKEKKCSIFRRTLASGSRPGAAERVLLRVSQSLYNSLFTFHFLDIVLRGYCRLCAEEYVSRLGRDELLKCYPYRV